MIGQTVPSTAPTEWPEVPDVTLPATGSDLVVLVVLAAVVFLLAACSFLLRRRLR